MAVRRAVSFCEAVHDGGDAAGDRGAVDGEQHRGAGRSGDVGAGGEAVGAQRPVEQTHDALDDRDVRWLRRGGAVQ